MCCAGLLMQSLTVERTVVCRSDVCSIWNAITDTERLNRAIGNNRIEFKPLSDGSAARYLARTRLGGFDVEYEERPFEWEYLKRFRILRKMRNGPVASLDLACEFESLTDGASRVGVKIALTPRMVLLAPVVKLSATQVANRLEKEIRRLDADIAAGNLVATRSRSPVDVAALERATAALRRVDQSAAVDQLTELLRSGDDVEVSRLRPYALADRWSLPRRDVLTTCLRAVKAGLLELRWDIVCPSCRTVSNSIPSLSALQEHGSCQLCDIQFGLELDQVMEATFAPAKAVRRVDEGPYCSGGPARTPHVFAQAILPPNSSQHLGTPLEPGLYRVFMRGGAFAPLEISAGAPSRLEVNVEAATGARLAIAPGGTLVVRNESSDERHAKLERLEWNAKAASAREVTALPDFRRDFASDVLRPGSQIKVSRMGLFFSDLSDSTKLYADTGDAIAFRLVQEHFDLLVPVIEKHGGAVVKTIGDAIMAVFSDDWCGLAASLEMLRVFEHFRATNAEARRTHVKLGFYSGPCFVLTANKVLDYFGQTVNVAARLQAQARSGEVVIEESFADEAIARGALNPEAVIERYGATLKGVEHPIRVARVVALAANAMATPAS